MRVYIEVDFHARQQTLSYLTTEDGEIHQLELAHEQDEVRAFYTQWRSRGKVVVGFESSGYAAWFEELLEELGCGLNSVSKMQVAARRLPFGRRHAARLC
jgi:hypothetical protein